MSEERFRELWAQVEHIGKIEHLSDDALLALGGIFGELKSKINEQAERVQELVETNKKNYWIASDFKFENLVLEQQNKLYREAIEETKNIIEEAIESLDNNEKVQGLEWAIKRIDEALEGESK